MKRGPRARTLFYMMSFLMVLASCRPPHPSFRESSRELVKLIDTALAAGLEGKPMPTPDKGGVTQIICVNDEAAPTGEIQASYEYQFPISVLGPQPDAKKFVQAVESVWRKSGMVIQRDNSPGLVDSFGTGNDFTLRVLVNFNTNMVLVGGNGPCTKGPPKPSPDLDGP